MSFLRWQISDALVRLSKGNEAICLAQSQSSANTVSLLGARRNVLPFWGWKVLWIIESDLSLRRALIHSILRSVRSLFMTIMRLASWTNLYNFSIDCPAK